MGVLSIANSTGPSPVTFQPPAGTCWKVYAIESVSVGVTTHIYMIYDGSIWVTLLRETIWSYNTLAFDKGKPLLVDNVHHLRVQISAGVTRVNVYYEQIPEE